MCGTLKNPSPLIDEYMQPGEVSMCEKFSSGWDEKSPNKQTKIKIFSEMWYKLDNK